MIYIRRYPNNEEVRASYYENLAWKHKKIDYLS